MVKKRVTPRKPTRKAKGTTARASSSRADRSRLDLEPLQRHIRRRIKQLQGGAKPVATRARSAESTDDTIERLKNVLETLEEICWPAMDIPI